MACSARLAAPAALAADRSVAVIVVPPLRAGGVRGPRRRRAARARRGLDGVPRAGARLPRARAGRLVARRSRRRAEPAALATPAATTIYVSLPPPGSHHNVVRYPVAIVGPGYRGLLTSNSTRIDGFVSLADIAPTAKAIAAGRRRGSALAPTTSRPRRCARLDERLARAHDARTGATLVLVGWLVAVLLARHPRALGARGPCRRARRAGGARRPRSCLRAIGVDDPTAVVVASSRSSPAPARCSSASGRRCSFLPSSAFLAAFLVVLAAWPEVNALAAIGPHPDGGGRFFGVTNQVETLLLAPSLAAAAAAGVAGAVGIGLLLLVLVGWSRAGADGGGLLVVAAAFAVLLAGLARIRLTPTRLALGVAGVLAVGLALVGIDALLGGSSHVTDAVGGGPGTLFDDLDRRLRISWAGATSAAHTAFLCLLSLGGLAWLGIRGRQRPAIVAMLVAIGVSLLVNDTPVDVLGYGALGCLALTAWEETRAGDALSERNAASSRLPEPQERPAH